MRSKWITLRLTIEEAARIAESAKEAGMSLSSHARMLALSALAEHERAASVDALLAKFDALQTGLNTLADTVKIEAAGVSQRADTALNRLWEERQQRQFVALQEEVRKSLKERVR